MTESPALPPFSGRPTCCPKCGAGLNTVWHPKDLGCFRMEAGLPREHLCRVCPICKWWRVEATADTGRPAPADREHPRPVCRDSGEPVVNGICSDWPHTMDSTDESPCETSAS